MGLSDAERRGLDVAIEQAELGLSEGGIPIGSALLNADGEVVARGHNRREQDGDPTAHAEVDCIRNAGRRRDWNTLTLVSTLSPCIMCTGTSLLFKIPRVIIGENRTFRGAEHLFEANGVDFEVADDPRCFELMRDFIKASPELWAEDIGE